MRSVLPTDGNRDLEFILTYNSRGTPFFNEIQIEFTWVTVGFGVTNLNINCTFLKSISCSVNAKTDSRDWS